MKLSLSLLLALPLSLMGQGFILSDSFVLEEIDMLDVINIDSYSDPNNNGFIYTKEDSVFCLSINNTLLEKNYIPTTTGPSGFEIGSVQLFADYSTEYNYKDEYILYNITNGTIHKKKGLKSKQHKSIEYSFQDKNSIYLISYYNRDLKDKSESHDLISFYKISKKNNRLVKVKSFDIGKEIILAPFNHQLISFNRDHFFITDRIGHRLFKISTEFKMCDTIILNKKIGLDNINKFNKTFPDESVKRYLHQPKLVIDHFTSSINTKNLTTIFKTLFLDDTTLAIVYKNGNYPSFTFDLEIRNANSFKIIYKKKIAYLGDDLSPFTWTRRIYTTKDGNFLTISLGSGINRTKYIAKIWNFSHQKSITKNMLTDSLSINSSILKSFSGIILADEYFCKGCFGSSGPGKGTLVISKQPDVNSDILEYVREKQKRQWKINGDLLYVSAYDYATLKQIISPNYLTPIVEQRETNR